MIVLTLKAKHDHLRKVAATRDYVKALGEFVWNAVDADATQVSVDFVRNALGGLESILVRDNGTGITKARAQHDFESLGDSWKLAANRTALLSHAVHGKEGQGRFRFFSLAQQARWTTVYDDDGERLRLSIEIGADRLHTSKVTELGAVPRDTPTGTTVELAPLKGTFDWLAGAEARADFGATFAPYVLQYPDTTIFYDGHPGMREQARVRAGAPPDRRVRGLGSATLSEQIAELVALSAGGRTDRPAYHVFCSPNPEVADNPAVRARFWSLFENEFGMAGQPYCGVEHLKDGRLHEHRVYSLVRPSGSVVSLSWDYSRREKCARIVEQEAGMQAVPSKHSRAIVKALRQEGRHEVADWLAASGTTEAERPVARLTPRERLIEERTGTDLDEVRRTALAAWRETEDGTAFLSALRARGLDLRQGRVGPVIVDAAGTAHLATRILGAAARRFEGERIPAAAVKARLIDLNLQGVNDGDGRHNTAAGRARTPAPRDPGGGGIPGTGWVGLRRPGGDLVRPDGGRGGGDGGRTGAALERLRAAAGADRAVMVRRLGGLDLAGGRYLAAAERGRQAAERIDAMADAKQRRAWALWGLTDIWGIPLQ